MSFVVFELLRFKFVLIWLVFLGSLTPCRTLVKLTKGASSADFTRYRRCIELFSAAQNDVLRISLHQTCYAFFRWDKIGITPLVAFM